MRSQARPRQALITGGTTGIGFGIATAMADAGYDVTVTGLTEEQIASVPGHLSAVRLDVTSGESVAAVLAPFQELAALINCAGVIFRDSAEYEIETFQRVIDVNLTGTMRMCVGARAKLAAARGAIVNTASMLSFFGGPSVPAYTASKGGVAQLTKALAVAWAAEGIRVNAVAPGWIATELTRGLVEDQSRSAAILNRTPMERWGEPGDVGGAAVFLCSEAARFITGAILPVDGGYAAMWGSTMSNVTVNHSGRTEAEARVPYRHPQPKESFPELVIPNAIPEDERLWVPQQENVWFRPLCLSASRGYWMNLLRVRKSGVLSRHRHPQPVHGFVLKGSWHYLEHDWTATEGAYVYEAPGETHTLVVEADVPEMITLFQVNGAMIYVDPDGRVLGYEDVFTKIDLCRRHFAAVGLGEKFVDQFLR